MDAPEKASFMVFYNMDDGSSKLTVKFGEEEARPVLSVDKEGSVHFFDAFGEEILVYKFSEDWNGKKINDTLDEAWQTPGLGAAAQMAYGNIMTNFAQQLAMAKELRKQREEGDDDDTPPQTVRPTYQ